MSDQYPTSPDILSTFSNSTPAIPVQTITASSRQRQDNSKKISKDTVTMLNRLSLENLPLEVIHQIFAFLPLTSLTSLRLTSRSILSSATSNSHWRSHFYSLLPQHIALVDVAAIPASAWSFSLVPDGWFRAYTKLLQIARSNWLLTDEQLKESKWTVSFKAFLREGGARGSSEGSTGYHALVEMRSDLTCHPVQGLPLNSSSWYVDARPSLRFSGYPPNVPSRDPYTWCRIMQHVSVLMVTDAPEFLDALVALNEVMLEEATVGRESVREKQKREFEVVVKEVLERRKSEFDERLKQLHVKRSGGMEMGEDPVGGVGSGGGVVNEENDWSVEDDESDNEGGEWSDDGGYDHSLDRCLLYQQFREQRQLQNSSSSTEASEQSKSSEEAMEDADSEEP